MGLKNSAKIGDRLLELSDWTYIGGSTAWNHGARLERDLRPGEDVVAAARCYRLFGEKQDGGIVLTNQRLFALPELHTFKPSQAITAIIFAKGGGMYQEFSQIKKLVGTKRESKPGFFESLRTNWVELNVLEVHVQNGDAFRHESVVEEAVMNKLIAEFKKLNRRTKKK